jgi:hypothetical protein
MAQCGVCRSAEKSNCSGVGTNPQDKVRCTIPRVLLYCSLHFLRTFPAFLYRLSSSVCFCAISLIAGTMQFVSVEKHRVCIDVRICIKLFRDVTLCSPIEVYRCFGRTYRLFICDGFFLCSLPDAEDTGITILRNVGEDALYLKIGYCL